MLVIGEGLCLKAPKIEAHGKEWRFQDGNLSHSLLVRERAMRASLIASKSRQIPEISRYAG